MNNLAREMMDRTEIITASRALSSAATESALTALESAREQHAKEPPVWPASLDALPGDILAQLTHTVFHTQYFRALGALVSCSSAFRTPEVIEVVEAAKRIRELPRKQFKVILVGDGGVGKTTFATRHFKERPRTFVSTLTVEVHCITFATTQGELTFETWDTAGQEKFGALRDSYYVRADAGIVMFDMTSRMSYKNVPNWHRDVRRICGDEIPMVVAGNKVDRTCDRKVKMKQITFPRKHGAHYVEMSALANHRIDEPFLLLARQLLRDPSVEFLGGCATSLEGGHKAPLAIIADESA